MDLSFYSVLWLTSFSMAEDQELPKAQILDMDSLKEVASNSETKAEVLAVDSVEEVVSNFSEAKVEIVDVDSLKEVTPQSRVKVEIVDVDSLKEVTPQSQAKVEIVDVDSSKEDTPPSPEKTETTVAPEEKTEATVGTNPFQAKVIALQKSWANFKEYWSPRWQAYREQWPRTFLTWFLSLLVLSVLVWRIAPGDASISTFTPAQGLLIPISVFGGPAIIAAFIASHSGLDWYSDNIGVKALGLAILDSFFKLRAVVLRSLGFNTTERKISTNGIIDLPFPGLGYQGFKEERIAPDEDVSPEKTLESLIQYQLDNIGSIAVSFFGVYLLIKLPTIILWEVLSLTIEWAVYKFGFWIAHIPFPELTLYHWELFAIENLAAAVVIFFQEIKIDTSKPILRTQPLQIVEEEMKEVS
jgi:hypothetical protein